MSLMDKLKSLFAGGSGADASSEPRSSDHDRSTTGYSEEAAAPPLGTPSPVDPLGTPMPGAGAGAPGTVAPPTDDDQL
jgi:hypothetical protein